MSSTPPRSRFLVAQLGARRRYAVPRALHAAGMLERLSTDICAVRGWPRMLRSIPRAVRPGGLARLLERVPTGIPPSKLTAHTAFGWEYHRRLRRALAGSELAVFMWGAQRFCDLVLPDLANGPDALYVYNGAGLELLHAATARGLPAVLEQTIAPRALEARILAEERASFPEWEAPEPGPGLQAAFIDREVQEWTHSDLILCPSEFVRSGIASSGGPVGRCVVVPYATEMVRPAAREPRAAGKLRVLTVGAVGLRKGAPYVMAAARSLRDVAEFRMVGPITTNHRVQGVLAGVLQLTGVVPHSEIADHFRWADVFLLPSLCEGSASATYEALAAGLPVVCTTSSGSVVRDGVDGFIVGPRDVPAIVERLVRLSKHRDLLVELSGNAVDRAREFGIAGYSARLLDAFQETRLGSTR